MAFAITQACCNDASCVSVCPVNCIHPTPEERAFGSTDMLHIDPRSCIDCGACADACPVDAIFPVDRLRGPDTAYAALNAAYFEGTPQAPPTEPVWEAPSFPLDVPAHASAPRIAIVGTGPAASYAAQFLLTTNTEVTMIDRLPVPGGLLRYGVAPDHPATKRIGERFAAIYDHPRVRALLNVEVGVDVSHEELTRHHDAVIYAVGAAGDRPLEVPGSNLPGVLSARSFVAWYNAHPEAPAADIDLSAERVVVVGTGNVALDVARILLSDPEDLAATDISDRALAALRTSRVREVVLVGRRGPEHAAYSRGELLGVADLRGVSLVVDHDDDVAATVRDAAAGSAAALLRDVPTAVVDWSVPPPAGRRLVLRFHTTPVGIAGEGRVERVDVRRTTGRTGTTGPAADASSAIAAGLVLTSIGYRGRPVPGLPFDPETGAVPHDAGRVVDPATGRPVPGAYVTGWVKRGPSGGIGANRSCAQETVATLLADVAAGALPAPTGSARAFRTLVTGRRSDVVGRRELAAIDDAERRAGREQGRPRVKLDTLDALLDAGRSATLLRR